MKAICHRHAAQLSRCRFTLAGLLALALTLPVGRPAAATPSATGPVLRTITTGLWPAGLVEDPTVGHALVFNSWGPSAMVIDIRRGTVLRTLAIGSKYDFVWPAVDPLAHRFVLSLPRGVISKGGGNVVYLLDSRSGVVLKTLQGLRAPMGVAVDPARSHIFVADMQQAAVLQYDSRTGALERVLPSCHGTEDLAVSSATGHLFVRCSNGTILMHDLATGSIIRRLTSQATGTHNLYTDNFGTDTDLVLQEQTRRLIVANQATGAARLYDTVTGRLIQMFPAPSGSYAIDTVHHTIIANAFSPNECTQPAAGRFAVLNGTTGAALARYTMPYLNSWVKLVNPLTGHLVAEADSPRTKNCNILGPGTLFALDARTGRVLRSLPVKYSPGDMLVDRQAGLLLLEAQGTGSLPGTLFVLNLRQL